MYSAGATGAPSNLVDADSSQSGTGVDDAHSQAESSIKNGEIVASAQGTKNGGTAQTQVQGSYSGTGSFSASAQTSDKDRAAQAQVHPKTHIQFIVLITNFLFVKRYQEIRTPHSVRPKALAALANHKRRYKSIPKRAVHQQHRKVVAINIQVNRR